MGQAVPVRLYRTDERLTIAAPMPGLEAEDIAVTIQDGSVSIRGEQRGPGQHDRDLIVAEWTIGPYLRELPLPSAVRGDLANATYGNGVLVVSMPKAAEGEAGTAADFRLRRVGTGRGEHVGHQGRKAQAASTAEHAARKHGQRNDD